MGFLTFLSQPLGIIATIITSLSIILGVFWKIRSKLQKDFDEKVIETVFNEENKKLNGILEDQRATNTKILDKLDEIVKTNTIQNGVLIHLLAKEITDIKKKAEKEEYVSDDQYFTAKSAYFKYHDELNGNGEITKAFEIIDAIYKRGNKRA